MNHTPHTHLRRVLAVALAVASSVVIVGLAVPESTPATADGTPDISLTKSMPDEVLLGEDIPVTLTVSNGTGTDGFNVLIRDVLPSGVSYVDGSATPSPVELPQGDGTTVLVWRNLFDSLAGTNVPFTYQIETDGSFDVGDSVTNSATAVVNSDPRVNPSFDGSTGVPANFTGNADASDSTLLVPFILTKAEPSAESELLRGVHDHQTVYTLTVENNPTNPTDDFTVVDFLPAELEFLGCGTGDNTTTGEEYTSSGAIPNYGGALPNGTCVVPSSVSTVDTDPDGAGPMPSGVYTRVEWNAAAIAAARGSDDLGAGASFAIDYVAAIPLRENVFPGPSPATSNLDNNTGALTTESESAIENYAEATGDYNGTTSFTDSDTTEVIAEDISIHKTGSTGTIAQGGTITYTLTVETSEYATSTGPITVTDTIPASLDFDSAVPAPTSGPVLNPDGSETYTWVLPAFSSPSETTQVTLDAIVRDNHRLGDGSAGIVVGSNDSLTNTTALTADVTVINDNDASSTTIPLDDASSATATSSGPTIAKDVSLTAPGLTCTDGTGVAFDPELGPGYGPGDRVCFRLDVQFPAALDTISPIVQDYLPDGFTLDTAAAGGGWQLGASNTIPAGDVSFTDSSPLLQWDLADVDAGGQRFQVVIQAVVGAPDTATDDDIIENLHKFRYSNRPGEVFQLRDLANVEWSEPVVDLTKGIIEVNSGAVSGAPSNDVTVEESDVVTYQLTITNTGSADALDVSVRDTLPTGITCAEVSSISSGGACDGANDWIQWDTDDDLDVTAGGSITLTYDLAVPVGTGADAELVNTAGVREFSDQTNQGGTYTHIPRDNIDPTLTPNTTRADDTATVRTSEPALSKTRTTSIVEAGNDLGEATIGETISYTVDLTLFDNLTYAQGVIEDNLDAEKDLVAGSVAATVDGGALPVGWTLDVDDPGNSWLLTLPDPLVVPNGPDVVVQVTFDAIVTDVGSNTRNTNTNNRVDFDFEDSGGDSRNVNDSVSSRIVEPNLDITKTDDDADGIVESGQGINYSIDVTNDDGVARVSTAHDLVIVDTVPQRLIVLDAPAGSPVADGGTVGPDGGTWDETGRTITWTITSIDPGDTVTLDYQAVLDDPVVAGVALVNTAAGTATSMAGSAAGERTSSSPNAGPGSGYESSDTESVSVPGYAVTKTATPATATIGEPVTYTVDATIPADVVAFDVTIIDDIPDGIVFESLTSLTCDQGGGVCSPDITIGGTTLVPAGPHSSGSDVAFFLDDLITPATADRVVTITYVARVADVAAADTGATLTNGANVFLNQSDTITTPPTAVPSPGAFDVSGTEATDDVDTVEPTLTIDKDVVGQVGDTDTRRARAGDTLTYTVTVTNTGTSAAHDITVVDVPTDPSWAFTDTTTASGVTNTDADPVGGLEWTISGPLAPAASVDITYELVVPAGFTSADENPTGPELTNTADVPSYFGVDETTRSSNPGRDYREYDDVTPDTVTIEVDLASIGDRVWLDADGDGIQDPDEPGLADVMVTVIYLGTDGVLGGGDDESFLTTTDASGAYLVEGLPGGNFLVDVDDTDTDLPGGLTPSFDLDDGTAAPDGAWTGPLGEDEDKRDVDVGFTGTGSIGDLVWFDRDRDGVQDAGEDGAAGVDVTVTWLGLGGVAGGGDDVEFRTTTDSDGGYLVDGLPAGEFTVVVDTTDLPAEFENVFDPDGGLDSTSRVTLAAGGNDLDQDFGFAGAGSIGDTIWLDLDGDGVLDPGEPGIPGAVVTVTWAGLDDVLGNADDVVYPALTTGADGTYLIGDLSAGTFTVEVTNLPAGLEPTADPDGGGDSSSTVVLAESDIDLDQDFGYVGGSTGGPGAGSSVGDTIFVDVDGDDVQDPNEPGVANVTVTVVLDGADGVSGTPDDIEITTETDENGRYSVTGLPAGDVDVSYDTTDLPAEYRPSSDLDGGDPTSTSVTLGVDEEVLVVDYPVAGDATITGSVWIDSDSDGVIDAGEQGIPNVTVVVTWDGPAGPVAISVTTDENGEWELDGIPAGEYTTEVDTTTVPADLIATTPTDGSATIPLGGTGNVDNGFVPAGSIGDRIWSDTDGDGVQDPDEAGVAGVVVILLDGDGTEIARATTDAEGRYVFGDLRPGTYEVVVDRDTLPTSHRLSADPEGVIDGRAIVTLDVGQARVDIDFGVTAAQLPVSGADVLTLLRAAAATVLLGLVLLLAVRRRRSGPVTATSGTPSVR